MRQAREGEIDREKERVAEREWREREEREDEQVRAGNRVRFVFRQAADLAGS